MLSRSLPFVRRAVAAAGVAPLSLRTVTSATAARLQPLRGLAAPLLQKQKQLARHFHAAAPRQQQQVQHAVYMPQETQLSGQVQALVEAGQFDEAERLVQSEVAQLEQGSPAHIANLRQQAKLFLMQNKFPQAEEVLRQALSFQQKVYEKNISPETFHSSVDLLSFLVTCVRMSGINPSDQSSLDVLFDQIYCKGIREPLLKKDASFASALEDPVVYNFVCYVVGCYIDGENFNKAKNILEQHMLYDLSSATPVSPASPSTGYSLRDLRLASGLNFRGIAEWTDHSACSGGGHAHHHHTHDHSAAEKSWKLALDYLQPFIHHIRETKPIGKLSPTDALSLQAVTVILDNLTQVAMSGANLDEAVRLSKETVDILACAMPELSDELLAAQAQMLKTYLEAQRMDDAELLCEQMLRLFPHPSRTPNPSELRAAGANLPSVVSLSTSRVLDDLSHVMYQFQNLDYAEKFLQISLAIQHARLPPPAEGQEEQLHPNLARAYNGLGMLQLQMKDYASAESNFERALGMKIALSQQAGEGAPEDSGEFYHNLGLAKLGLQKNQEAEANLLAAKERYDARYKDAETGEVQKVQPNYAGLMAQLAQLYRILKQNDSALHYAEEAVRLKTQLFSASSPELVADLYLLASLLAHSFGRYADAIPHYKALVSVAERAQGPVPPNPVNLGISLHWLAHAYAKNDEPALAADAWRKSLVQLEKCMQAREVLAVQVELHRVLRQMELNEEAEALKAKMEKNELAIKQQQEQAEAAAKEAAAKEKEQKEQGEAGAEFTQA